MAGRKNRPVRKIPALQIQSLRTSLLQRAVLDNVPSLGKTCASFVASSLLKDHPEDLDPGPALRRTQMNPETKITLHLSEDEMRALHSKTKRY